MLCISMLISVLMLVHMMMPIRTFIFTFFMFVATSIDASVDDADVCAAIPSITSWSSCASASVYAVITKSMAPSCRCDSHRNVVSHSAYPQTPALNATTMCGWQRS
eukprot:CAMPEP_0119569390 /NCGR_PEP_ID=MMETSP1352-20130426/41489_1 /TAXON_ID=265584 /ORGANISM="Stauroneis constricta, Strain CCMP1120" /LENGTH=105 /DNA_ID=CAMNT_0007618931 /DNA_START=86 /DNA_END=400 /DNA_ORIENTATION=+